MRLLYINPNATASMTDGIVAAARAALPGVEIMGVTNTDGPPAIEGPEDGDRAVPGVLARVAAAEADAVVIACFDDTGLAEAQALSSVPVLGIGQASYLMATLLGQRFSVVTSLAVSLPVIRENIAGLGFEGHCASVRASGLPVLVIDEGAEDTRVRLAEEIVRARDEDGAGVVVLGCAGMAPLRADLEARSGVTLIDGVAAAAHLAVAAAGFRAG
ncbi:aspartate/glutamate racemase family protein [Pseudooceanicola nanhaiensis]|uniref:aspartate/glutamate racemase family protein n=1 Tax=Pseudooceanicola nanhaiensis TaxID=375761 RepID=UPI001CD22449|nr:aspartate/glutamate racemase family protein [Pseudooceanicola nanhaiensis]MCA0922926.1 aspartate/glutamate racemase family protein [Pseudooceanicola nanhaiensis]